MGAVVRVARGLLPRLLGSALLVALLMGTAGGLATGLVSGGMRTRTAVERLIAQTHLPDVMLVDPTLDEAQVDEIRNLPGVDGAVLLTGSRLLDRRRRVRQHHRQRRRSVRPRPRRAEHRARAARLARCRRRGRAQREDRRGTRVSTSATRSTSSPTRPNRSPAGRADDATEEERADFGGPDVDVGSSGSVAIRPI